MNVPLLDLKRQYASLKDNLERAVLGVMESQVFILGEEVKSLERELQTFLGTKHCLGVSSGTDALLIALMAIDLQPGDEVIVPTYSFFATAGAVARLNAVPVFADIDPRTYNLDPAQIEARITKRTKAIIPVHLYGQAAAMAEIMKIAKKHQLIVIEDAAQAIGVRDERGIPVGTIGDIGCYSFFPSKNLGCFGDGGLVSTNNDQLSEKMRILRVHGGKPKYYHQVIGGNFRLDALQAAILRVKLPYLDEWSRGRYENAKRYDALFVKHGLSDGPGRTTYDGRNTVLLPGIVHEASGHPFQHIFNQYVVRVERRDELREQLSTADVKTEIYYPVPFHRQECFKSVTRAEDRFPVADISAAQTIALPIFPELTDVEQSYVVETISDFFRTS